MKMTLLHSFQLSLIRTTALHVQETFLYKIKHYLFIIIIISLFENNNSSIWYTLFTYKKKYDDIPIQRFTSHN